MGGTGSPAVTAAHPCCPLPWRGWRDAAGARGAAAQRVRDSRPSRRPALLGAPHPAPEPGAAEHPDPGDRGAAEGGRELTSGSLSLPPPPPVFLELLTLRIVGAPCYPAGDTALPSVWLGACWEHTLGGQYLHGCRRRGASWGAGQGVRW